MSHDDPTFGEAPPGVDPLLAIHALEIQTLLGYHDTSCYDPPSSHDPGVEDLWDCPPCVERFIERARNVLGGGLT